MNLQLLKSKSKKCFYIEKKIAIKVKTARVILITTPGT